MPFKAHYLSPEGDLRLGLNEQEVRAASESKEGLLWVDVAETTEEDAELMERILSLHHLAVEDCLSAAMHPPKIDDFGDYLEQDDNMVRWGNPGVLGSEGGGSDPREARGPIMRQTMRAQTANLVAAPRVHIDGTE